MASASARDSEYIVLPEQKSKITTHYEDDDDIDDDADSQIVTTERVVRAKPVKEQVKYVTARHSENDYRRSRRTDSVENRIKVRQTTTGEQVILDEDDNVLKIIRNPRTPSPTIVIGNRRVKVRSNESRTVLYETPDGQLIARRTKRPEIVKKKIEFVDSGDEATKLVKKVVIDAKTGEQEVIYEKEKPRKHSRPKIIVRKPTTEIQVVSDDDDGQPEYVQVVQRRPAPVQIVSKREAPTKYVMIRKKAEPEPVYETVAAVKRSPRVVYRTSPKKPSFKYVYASDGKL